MSAACRYLLFALLAPLAGQDGDLQAPGASAMGLLVYCSRQSLRAVGSSSLGKGRQQKGLSLLPEAVGLERSRS